MKKQIFLIVVILIIIAAVLVLLFTGERKTAITGSGMIEVEEVDISARINGRIEKLTAAEGDLVEKGDTLGVIEHRELLARRRKALTGLNVAKLSLEEIRLKKKDFKKDLERIRELYAVGDVAKKELENYELQYRLLKMNEEKAKENIEGVSADLELIKTQLENAFITSPISGVVLARNFEEGEAVFVGARIFRIGDLNRAWLKIYLPETEIGKISLGSEAEVHVDAYPDEVYKGRVTWISREAEFTPKNIQTKEERADLVFAVKITIPNPEQKLLPGMPADAEILENAHR